MATEGPATKTEELVEEAAKSLAIKPNSFNPGGQYSWILKRAMLPDEKILLGARQSYFDNLAPGLLLITNKRIITLKPSFWGLYLKMNLSNPSQAAYYQYKNITGIIFTKGYFLCSLTLQRQGDSLVIINGLRYTEDKSVINFIEKIVELQG